MVLLSYHSVIPKTTGRILPNVVLETETVLRIATKSMNDLHEAVKRDCTKWFHNLILNLQKT